MLAACLPYVPEAQGGSARGGTPYTYQPDRVPWHHRLAYSFLGWLIFDIVHLVLWFPKLGAADMLAHHIGFFCLTCLGVSYRVMPFPVSSSVETQARVAWVSGWPTRLID